MDPEGSDHAARPRQPLEAMMMGPTAMGSRDVSPKRDDKGHGVSLALSKQLGRGAANLVAMGTTVSHGR